MLSINTNLSSLIVQNSLKKSTLKLNQAVERMSTGYKINHAKDNAANYSIATNMTTKISAFQIAEDNTATGLDMLTTASDSLNLIADKLTRLRALAEQAANGTYGQQSLKTINAEANAIVDEILRVHSTTEYNGLNLFGKYDSFINPVTERDTSTMTAIADTDVLVKGETYSVSTAKELIKLGQMNTENIEIVLANDIDLSGYTENGGWKSINFSGTFDGNGHVIYNLYINNDTDTEAGLFKENGLVTFKNLGVENVNIRARSGGAIDGGVGAGANFENCYSTGKINLTGYGGGLCQEGHNISNSWSSVDITSGGSCIGGLAGFCTGVSNSYSTGNVTGLGNCNAGGIAGKFDYFYMDNCYSTGTISAENGTAGGLVGEEGGFFTNCYVLGESKLDYIFAPDSLSINNCYYSSFYNNSDIVKGVNATSYNGTNPFGWQTSSNTTQFNLQVGISGNSASQIELNTKFLPDAIGSLRGIGNSNGNYLSVIDNMLQTLNAKQTEFGAVQNRLESALDEISTQYENLISSRSTLKDADIAEVSSEYIKQQILQQASATLLSTANQSPALALQLL